MLHKGHAVRPLLIVWRRDVQDELAGESTVIFVVATYGEGEPTDNAKEFYSWLMSEDRDPSELETVHYAVFGSLPSRPAARIVRCAERACGLI